MLGRNVRFNFDGDTPVVLKPKEGASRLTYYFGTSEPETFEFMDRYLAPGMVVVDVGANIGLNAVYAAKRVGREGIVLAVEPDPYNIRRIHENLASNAWPQLKLVEAACGASGGGRVRVRHDGRDSSRSYVEADGDPNASDGVTTTSIDELVDIYNLPRIDYLKIDVEGFEQQVLEGAVKTLAAGKVAVLHVELDEKMLQRSGSGVGVLLNILERHRYRPGVWIADSGRFEAKDSVGGYYSFFIPAGER